MSKQNEHKQLVERGMQLAASLPDIMPDKASEQLKPIYEDIQQQLRVPLVNLIFRSLANYPDYLEQIWQHFSPVLRSNSFEQQADNLRERALLDEVPGLSDSHWEKIDGLEKLRAFNDTIFYVLPKLLLIATAFDEATFRSIRDRGGRDDSGLQAADVPAGPAEGTTQVEMLDPEKASGQLKALFTSIKETHSHPLVSSYFRGLGNWPDFLQEVWQQIKPLVGSAEYNSLREYLVEQAFNSIRKLPLSQPQLPAMEEEQKEAIRALLAAFRYKFIPEMLIDATLIKAMLDGPEEAYTSRFSAASSED